MKTILMLGSLGSLLVGGVLLAFSSFIMAALARIPAASGISAMQAINVMVINPVFMGLFMGTGLISLAALVLLARNGLMMSTGGVAALLYLAGVLGVTFAFNVPMNNALAAVDPASTASSELWNDYVSRWTTWNHVRCAAAAVAGVLFMFAWR
jgi:uncharacterized membrane protein